jgi:hypothetical protein
MRERMAPWLVVSLFLSIAAFAVAGVAALGAPNVAAFSEALFVSTLFSTAWLLVFMVALFVHRWRGLWLLVGSPAAIFWPAEELDSSLSYIRSSPAKWFWVFAVLILLGSCCLYAAKSVAGR